jgi:hypothetical protein
MRNGAGDCGVRVDEYTVGSPHVPNARKRFVVVRPSCREIGDSGAVMPGQLKEAFMLEFAHRGCEEFRIVIERKVQEPLEFEAHTRFCMGTPIAFA